MFADITGSTRLYDTLGNEAAKALVSRCMDLLSAAAVACHGRVIKTIGDEVMCTFPDATRGAQAANEMQLAVKQAFPGDDGGKEMRISVGLHLGPVLLEGDDVFGDTVNVAARMVGIAKPSQILATRDLVDALPPELRMTTRFYDQATLKGKADHFDIYELIWEVSGLTMVSDSGPRAEAPENTRLVLRFGDQEIEVTSRLEALTLGRGDKVDLQVRNGLASRQHARIEYRRGRFLLIDQSVNGTHVVDEAGRSVHVRREEHVLKGSGSIGLGEPPDLQPQLAVHYTCE